MVSRTMDVASYANRSGLVSRNDERKPFVYELTEAVENQLSTG